MKRKVLISIVAVIIYHSLTGQTTATTYTIEKIDSIVSKIDSVARLKHRVFNLKKQYRGNTYTEKWSYLRDAKYLLYFQVNYTLDSNDYEEEYYLTNGGLIYATEKEVMRFPSMDPVDSIGWSGVFYFSAHKLLYQRTLGHGKSEMDNWDPEKEIRVRYSKRRYRRPELLTWSK